MNLVTVDQEMLIISFIIVWAVGVVIGLFIAKWSISDEVWPVPDEIEHRDRSYP